MTEQNKYLSIHHSVSQPSISLCKRSEIEIISHLLRSPISSFLTIHGMAFSFSTLKSSFIVLTLISSLLFFFLNPPLSSSHHHNHHRILLSTTTCSDDLCFFPSHPLISLFFLCLLSLFLFYLLLTTASLHFSPITTLLSSLLRLSPSMAAVTLLALGNGSPDVFSSLISLRSGHYRTGFAAILSAGAFVSAFVVGFVAIHAAPFPVDPFCFVRDVGFYLVAALFLFYVYLSGEIFLWQAVGFVGFYVFFVGVVFWMDLGLGGKDEKRRTDMEVGILEADRDVSGDADSLVERLREDGGEGRGSSGVYGKVWS